MSQRMLILDGVDQMWPLHRYSFPLHGSQGLNSGSQAQGQQPLSHLTSRLLFLTKLSLFLFLAMCSGVILCPRTQNPGIRCPLNSNPWPGTKYGFPCPFISSFLDTSQKSIYAFSDTGFFHCFSDLRA